MKNKSKIMAILTAFTVLIGSSMPICASAAEITEPGNSNVTVSLTCDAADVTWFKVQLPTSVVLEKVSSNGEGFAVYEAQVGTVGVKGNILPSKVISLRIPNEFSIIGQTDSSKYIEVDANMALWESGGVLDPNFVAGDNFKDGYSKTKVNFYANGYTGLTESNVGAAELSPNAYNTCSFGLHAGVFSPTPQVYSGEITFIIRYEDI